MNNRRHTVRREIVSAGLLGALALLAASADAQLRWGRPAEPRNGACFYREPDFEGDYFCTGIGEEIASVPSSMANQIVSIRTFGNAEVTVFQSPRFGGRSKRFNREVSDLTDEGWSDRLSSLRVMKSSSGSGYGGSSGNNNSGRPIGDPDKIVRRAYQDILDREPDNEGMRTYRSRIIDDGWTEEKVREALRKSPEYREKTTMTPEKAKETVRRAYLSVLNREPDAEGSQGFVDNVLRKKWTEQDVARELRKSDEYLSKKK